MQETYKGHSITVGAWLLTDTKQWEALITIGWTASDDKVEFARPHMTRTFPTKAVAELAALMFAKNG